MVPKIIFTSLINLSTPRANWEKYLFSGLIIVELFSSFHCLNNCANISEQHCVNIESKPRSYELTVCSLCSSNRRLYDDAKSQFTQPVKVRVSFEARLGLGNEDRAVALRQSVRLVETCLQFHSEVEAFSDRRIVPRVVDNLTWHHGEIANYNIINLTRVTRKVSQSISYIAAGSTCY